MSIFVGSAGKVGEGVNAYYVFKVTSDMFSVDPMEVDRRYSDFLWLHTQLSRQCAGYIIPPLPVKVVPLLQGPEFLEHRRVGLERFLRKVVEHDELKNTNFFKSFLECSPVELTTIKVESQKQDSDGTNNNTAMGQMAQKTQQLNSWWGKAYQRMAENDRVKLLAAKAGRDLNGSTTIEDPDFQRVLKYVSELNGLVKTMQLRVQNAHKQNKLSAGAYCELIETMNSVADIEESLGVTGTTTASTSSADFEAVLALLDIRARLIDSELSEFAESVDYFARWVGAVMNAVNVREDRRFVYQAKLAAKAKQASSSEGLASQDVQDAKVDFERVHTRVMHEVKRFQVEKGVELRRMFAQYAKLQTRCNADIGNVLSTTAKALLQVEPVQPFSLTSSSNQHLLYPPFHADNQTTQELEEAMRKMEPTSGLQMNKKDPLLNENADPYSDVSL